MRLFGVWANRLVDREVQHRTVRRAAEEPDRLELVDRQRHKVLGCDSFHQVLAAHRQSPGGSTVSRYRHGNRIRSIQHGTTRLPFDVAKWQSLPEVLDSLRRGRHRVRSRFLFSLAKTKNEI
jgi:hypothetical protein